MSISMSSLCSPWSQDRNAVQLPEGVGRPKQRAAMKESACLFRKFEATRDSIRSRVVLAAILALLDSHGGQSLSRPFHAGSPFSGGPTPRAQRERGPVREECPMKGCQQRFLTPLDLINHLLGCGAARRGSVQCGRCDDSHAMTRLPSPTQLWRRLRRREPYDGPRLTPPAAAEEAHGGSEVTTTTTTTTHELDGYAGRDQLKPWSRQDCSFSTTELEGDRPSPAYGPRCPQELGNTAAPPACTSVHYRGQESCVSSAGGSCGSSVCASVTARLAAQPGSLDVHEMAAIERATELEAYPRWDAPDSTVLSEQAWQPAPSCFTLGEAPRQELAAGTTSNIVFGTTQQASVEASRAWSGASEASTLYEKQPQDQDSVQHALPSNLLGLQQQVFWNANACVSKPDFEVNARNMWISDAPPTVSPEYYSVPSATWPLDPPAYEAHNVADYHFGERTACFYDPEAPWQPSLTSTSDQSTASEAMPNGPENYVFSPTSTKGPAQNLRRDGNEVSVPDIQRHKSVAPTPRGRQRAASAHLDRGHAPPTARGRRLRRSNAFRSRGPLQPTPPPRASVPDERLVQAPRDDENLKCSVCGHRPTGQKKNRLAHLRRHEAIHKKERLKCVVRGCTTTFTLGREDNRAVHLKQSHSKSQPSHALRAAAVGRPEVDAEGIFEDASGEQWAGASDHSGQDSLGDLLMVAGEDSPGAQGGQELGDVVSDDMDYTRYALLDFGNAPEHFIAWPAADGSADGSAAAITAADMVLHSQLGLQVV